jgi:hypothetical protein
MKIGELTSFGHNVADSLASGICFMAGLYSVDIHREAAASKEGHITVDFLTGKTSGGAISDDLDHAVKRYAELLPELAKRHSIDISEITVFSARFGTDNVAGPHFLVTVESSDGRQSVDQYAGIPGKRYAKPRRSKSSA